MIDVDVAVCVMEILFLYLNVHFTISLPMYTIKFNFSWSNDYTSTFLDWIHYIRAATNYPKSFCMKSSYTFIDVNAHLYFSSILSF